MMFLVQISFGSRLSRQLQTESDQNKFNSYLFAACYLMRFNLCLSPMTQKNAALRFAATAFRSFSSAKLPRVCERGRRKPQTSRPSWRSLAVCISSFSSDTSVNLDALKGRQPACRSTTSCIRSPASGTPGRNRKMRLSHGKWKKHSNLETPCSHASGHRGRQSHACGRSHIGTFPPGTKRSAAPCSNESL